MAKNSYASETLTAAVSPKNIQFTKEKEVAKTARADNIDLKVTVDKIKFDRAVVIHNNQNVDYTKFDVDKNYGLIDPLKLPGAPGEPGTPADPANPGEGGSTSTWTFTGSTATPANAETKTTTAFVNWEAVDPRCNLEAADGSTEYWKVSELRTHNAGTVPTIGAKNEDANPKNTDLTKEMDLEASEDPANVSTAYIRNGVMKSVWELGFIHRGKPWQTINLKSADHNKDKEYLNDAVLLDEIAFYAPAADKEKEKYLKYNINYPYTHIAAFGPLVKELKYCPTNENVIPDDNDLTPADGTALSEVQWQSLRKWIAWKCYESSGGNPSKFDGAKNYHFYRHRGYLANVITDWALNCSDSPYSGQDKMDAYLEELISKITPLTRAGEPYEYFTIYIVAQTIKDVGGLPSTANLVRYDRSGNELSGTAQQGRWDPDFDEVTGEVFMVARVRRNLDCRGNDSCKDGKHVGGCQYGITVIESYTINEL